MMKQLVSIITTTINVPDVLGTYYLSDEYDIQIIVAGDTNTPTEAVDFIESLPNAIYLSTTDQRVTRWRTHTSVGFRSIQRRNLALLHAMSIGSDIIITIDDDNYPLDTETFIESFVTRLNLGARQLLSCDSQWYNPGRLLHPWTVARGFPITHRHIEPHLSITHMHDEPARIHVVAGLTIGDPDIDAIERIVNHPVVDKIASTATLDIGTWAPFNTQNTAYTIEVAPLMQCLVGVGRYDDILMSYIARKVMDDMGRHVYYGRPIVKQNRNVHDLIKDMKDEFFGYITTPSIIETLRNVTTHGTVFDRLATCYSSIAPLLPVETQSANAAWMMDATKAYTEGMRLRDQR